MSSKDIALRVPIKMFDDLKPATLSDEPEKGTLKSECEGC